MIKIIEAYNVQSMLKYLQQPHNYRVRVVKNQCGDPTKGPSNNGHRSPSTYIFKLDRKVVARCSCNSFAIHISDVFGEGGR